jgi:hypothetical protein
MKDSNALKIGMAKGNFARVGQDLTSNSHSHQFSGQHNGNLDSRNNFQVFNNKESA